MTALAQARLRLLSSSAAPQNPAAEKIMFWVNGQKQEVGGEAVDRTVLEYIRGMGLTGTKLVCGEGGCGSCTVEFTKYDHASQKLVSRPLNACLAFLPALHGASITTVEALSNKDCSKSSSSDPSSSPPIFTSSPSSSSESLLHPIQTAMAKHFGSQCGFCTPGFVMAMYSHLQVHQRQRPGQPVAPEELYHCLDGNLCRCTGYRPIADAVREIAASVSAHGIPAPAVAVAPEELRAVPCPVELRSPRGSWYHPSDVADLLRYLRGHPGARLVSGASEVCIENRIAGRHDPVKIGVQDLTELRRFGWQTASPVPGDARQGATIGPNLPLSDLLHLLEEGVAQIRQQRKTPTGPTFTAAEAMVDNLVWFSGNSIRNVATLGGNIMTASPISDINPILVAAGALLQLSSLGDDNAVHSRWVPAGSFFGPKYRQVAAAPGEMLTSIWVPHQSPDELVMAFKQARRREDDIAIVNACIAVKLDPSSSSGRVSDCSLAFGGMGPSVVQASAVAAVAIKGKDLKLPGTLDALLDALAGALALPHDVPGGMPAYRTTVALGFAKIFWLRFMAQHHPALLSEAERYDLAQHDADEIPSGRQNYDSRHVLPNRAAGTSIPHASSVRQVTGEATYTDDLPRTANELQGAVVLSKVASGKILSIDTSEAEKVPGFRGFISRQHVSGDNKIGDIVHDEDLFVDTEITTHAQIIGIVVCDDERDARKAASLIKITYSEPPTQPLYTIQEAIAAGSFIPDAFVPHHQISNSEEAELQALLQRAPHRIRSEVSSGPQEHFYFEPNATLAVPSDAELAIYCSSQNLNKTQMTLSSVLGMPAHRIKCSVKRIGGGFGGKETDSIKFSAAAAVAAMTLQRPVRIVLPRDVDFETTGKRHAFHSTYDVGFDAEGLIQAADFALYNNGGNWTDLSFPVLDRALFHCDNTYHFPKIRATGRVCRTNTISNTAFRGFGGPQGMVVAEEVIDHIAAVVNKTPEQIRELNMYASPSSRTHFGQELGIDIPRLWHEAKRSFGFDQQRAEVDAFNARHTYRKQGLSLLPTKFGLAFTATFLNQGSALVHVYTDGSVLISHGGIEMGQGLHTKCQAIAADALGIDPSRVYISESSTATIPNASPSAASMSSDIYCMAIEIACKQLFERLQPYKNSNAPNWLVGASKKAYFDRVSLSAQGYYKVPVQGYNMNTGTGTPFSYFTSGVALSRVELDTLTGDHHVIRSDVLMDVGNAINPLIDIGQIEGAFVQGQGWSTIEELLWADCDHAWASPRDAKHPSGRIITRGPGAYKIPSMDDIPKTFNIALLTDSANPRAVYSSRGIGEPPLFLGASVYYALRDALKAATGTAHCRADIPLTADKIRMIIDDDITKRVRANP
ncbi:MAG: molybdopterin-dependent oxidoreductase [archaeon]|nr:molybdopterin-dependent oxidoreductase [archaeon]